MTQNKQHKMTKQELKEDRLLSALVNFRHFMQHNKKNIVRGFAAFLVVLVVAVVYFSNQASKEAKAALQFENAYSLLRQPNIKKNINKVDKLLKTLIREYPGTFSAAKASYYLGNIQYQFGNFKGSLDSFKKAAAYGGSTDLYPLSLLGVGNSHEQLGQYAEAVRIYKRLIRKAARSGFVGTAKMSAARCLVALNKISEAKKLLDQVKRSSAWQKEAAKLDTYLGVLLRKSLKK